MRCPDWYPVIRAAKFGGVPVTEALGMSWGWIVERWCVIAETAEAQATEFFQKKAQRESRR